MQRLTGHLGLLTMFLSLAFGALAQAEEGQKLFNGESLEHWSGNEKFWSVKDGAIVGQTTKENPTNGNTFLIYKGGELGDFELNLKFKIDGGNSGIQYRSTDHGNHVVGGYQADFDDSNSWTGTLYEERGRGVLAKRGSKVVRTAEGKNEESSGEASEKEIVDTIKKGEWNDYTIIAKGNHLIHKVNGKVTVDFTDNEPSKAKQKGILALQLHAGPPMTVQFKDITLKELK